MSVPTVLQKSRKEFSGGPLAHYTTSTRGARRIPSLAAQLAGSCLYTSTALFH